MNAFYSTNFFKFVFHVTMFQPIVLLLHSVYEPHTTYNPFILSDEELGLIGYLNTVDKNKFLCSSTRGYIGVEDMTVARNCRLYLGLTGTTELANSEGTYGFHFLTVADGGEVTSTSEVVRNSLTLNGGEVKVQGGGALHMVRMRIFAGNFTVDDLGHVKGDPLNARSALLYFLFVNFIYV